MTQQINLSQLEPGQRAVIVTVTGKGAARRRMIDMGMTRGSQIQVIRKAPMGDPIDFKIKGYHLSLRKSDAELIMVEKEE
jgi:ferrous iron transport protein A